MSSSIISTILSAMLQLMIASIAIVGFISMRNSVLEYSFMDRSMELCDEFKYLSTLEDYGSMSVELDVPEKIGGYNYQVSFGNGNISISGIKNYSCSIPWLYGKGSSNGRSTVMIEWEKPFAYVHVV